MQSQPAFDSPKAHHNRQVSLWKRLRLIKKCLICRNGNYRSSIISGHLRSYDQNPHPSQSTQVIFTLMTKIEASRTRHSSSVFSSNNDPLECFYYSLSSSIDELRGLTHYYRFYQHIPIMPRSGVFRVLSFFKNRKKIIQYNRIWIRYNVEKSANGSTKVKTLLQESQRFLKGLTSETSKEEDLTLIKQLNFQTTPKNIEQIDKKYSFSRKTQKRNKSTNLSNHKYHKKQYETSSNCKNLHRKQHNSCFCLESNNLDLKSPKHSPNKRIKPQSRKRPENEIKEYISGLKLKIRAEKQALMGITNEESIKPRKQKVNKKGRNPDKKGEKVPKQRRSSLNGKKQFNRFATTTHQTML